MQVQQQNPINDGSNALNERSGRMWFSSFSKWGFQSKGRIKKESSKKAWFRWVGRCHNKFYYYCLVTEKFKYCFWPFSFWLSIVYGFAESFREPKVEIKRNVGLKFASKPNEFYKGSIYNLVDRWNEVQGSKEGYN